MLMFDVVIVVSFILSFFSWLIAIIAACYRPTTSTLQEQTAATTSAGINVFYSSDELTSKKIPRRC